MRKVQFTETVLRDANQSLIATRMPIEAFEPILETMDKASLCKNQETASLMQKLIRFLSGYSCIIRILSSGMDPVPLLNTKEKTNTFYK